jgi:hypothetical protein
MFFFSEHLFTRSYVLFDEQVIWLIFFFFFETEAKELPHSLIKKKRVAQFIYGKPGENRNNHEQTTTPRDNPT